MKNRILPALGLMALASVANAADLPSPRAPSLAVAAPPAFSWTGFYIGAHAGYLWDNTDVRAGDVSAGLLQGDLQAGILASRIEMRGDSAMGGIQAGYNVQSGMLVAGVEADISLADSDASTNYAAFDHLTFQQMTYSTFRSELRGLATLRGRAGVAFQRALVYVTGGLAAGEVKDTFGVFIPGFYNNKWTDRDTEWGWTVGAGVEYALTSHLSIKAEYLHYDLGARTYRNMDPAVFGTQYIDYKFKHDGDIVRGGVNFRF